MLVYKIRFPYEFITILNTIYSQPTIYYYKLENIAILDIGAQPVLYKLIKQIFTLKNIKFIVQNRF